MSFGEAIRSVFSKYATFSGRARRSEFWYFFLFNMIVSFVLTILGSKVPILGFLGSLWSLAILIPYLAVTVRRFHDIGKSGWNYLYLIIPSLLYLGYLIYLIIKLGGSFVGTNGAIDPDAFSSVLMENSKALLTVAILMIATLIAWIVWIVWMARDSQPGENKWGPNPKETPNSDPNATIY